METINVNIVDKRTSNFITTLKADEVKFLPRQGDFIEIYDKELIEGSSFNKSKKYKVIGIFHNIQPQYGNIWVNVFVEELPENDSK